MAGFLGCDVGHCDPGMEPWAPAVYMNTIIVGRSFRRRGVGEALNLAFEKFAAGTSSEWLTVRTWSENVSNLSLLAKRGYEVVLRLENHRGRGVDTVYLAKHVDR